MVIKDSAIIISALEKLSTIESKFEDVISYTNETSNKFFELDDKEKKKLSDNELDELSELVFNADPDRLFINSKVRS